MGSMKRIIATFRDRIRETHRTREVAAKYLIPCAAKPAALKYIKVTIARPAGTQGDMVGDESTAGTMPIRSMLRMKNGTASQYREYIFRRDECRLRGL